jgi:hypothetical protein
MIDPIQLPLLLKALDFVFDEGHRILKERRDRRKLENNPTRDDTPEPAGEVVPSAAAEEKIVKQSLLDSKIDEILWQNHQLETQHLVKLLETYSRNYYLAKEQYAKWGDALVPPIIVNNLQDAETSMIETVKKLEIVLSKVYKKEINPIQ